jgi:hypothetical protein
MQILENFIVIDTEGRKTLREIALINDGEMRDSQKSQLEAEKTTSKS